MFYFTFLLLFLGELSLEIKSKFFQNGFSAGKGENGQGKKEKSNGDNGEAKIVSDEDTDETEEEGRREGICLSISEGEEKCF